MNKQALTIVAGVFFLISSCKENKKEEQNLEKTKENLKTENLKMEEEQTYLYANNNDTILLELKNAENTISGKLDILRYQKDSRRGTINNGQIKGDTLFAVYKSMQEGQESECEVAFLKKEDSYIFSNDILGE